MIFSTSRVPDDDSASCSPARALSTFSCTSSFIVFVMPAALCRFATTFCASALKSRRTIVFVSAHVRPLGFAEADLTRESDPCALLRKVGVRSGLRAGKLRRKACESGARRASQPQRETHSLMVGTLRNFFVIFA
jgi:hypothetical protein